MEHQSSAITRVKAVKLEMKQELWKLIKLKKKTWRNRRKAATVWNKNWVKGFPKRCEIEAKNANKCKKYKKCWCEKCAKNEIPTPQTKKDAYRSEVESVFTTIVISAIFRNFPLNQFLQCACTTLYYSNETTIFILLQLKSIWIIEENTTHQITNHESIDSMLSHHLLHI